MTGKPRMVGEMVLVRSSVAKAPICRVRDWEVELIVRSDVKEALDAAKCRGINFEEVTVA